LLRHINIDPKKYHLSGLKIFKCKNYNLFQAGQFVTIIGNCMQSVALQWFVYQLTNSSLGLGLLLVFQYTPILIVSPFAGIFVDRFDKKKLLLATQFFQMAQAFLLAFLVISGHVTVESIYLLAAFLGVISAFDMPVRHSFHIDLVGKDTIIEAVGLNWTVYFTAKIIGSALAGSCLVTVGAGICFLLNGIGFSATVISLLIIKTHCKSTRTNHNSVLHEMRMGYQYIRNNRVLSGTIFEMLIVGVFVMNVDVIAPVFAEKVLSQTAGGYSILYSAFSFGSLLGALILLMAGTKLTNTTVLLLSAFLLGSLFVITSFANEYFISIILLAFIGFFQITFMMNANSMIQITTSDEFRGRVLSIYTLVQCGTSPFASLFTGIALERLTPNAVFLWAGTLALIFLMVIALIHLLNQKHARLKVKNKVSDC